MVQRCSCVVSLGRWFCVTVGTASGAAVAWRALKLTAQISVGLYGLQGLTVACLQTLQYVVEPLRIYAGIPRAIAQEEDAKQD